MAQSSSLEKSSMCRKWWPTAGGATPASVYDFVFSMTALDRTTDLLRMQKVAEELCTEGGCHCAGRRRMNLTFNAESILLETLNN